LNEIAKVAALSHVVTVYDRTMHRLLTRVDWAGEPLGPPKNIGGVETYAVLYEIGKDLDDRVHRLAQKAGVAIDASVFEPVRMRVAS
jgi:acyl homoserine lactone synthase